MVWSQTLLCMDLDLACCPLFTLPPCHRQINNVTLIYKLPTPLAHWILITDGGNQAQLNPGSIDVDYPFPCAPGIFGASNASSDQSGPQCSGACPKGFFCPMATSVPRVCRLGKYCPLASPAPLDCPAGTIGAGNNLTSADECESCPPGTSCAAGSSSPEPCAVGFFTPNSSSATCTSCLPGMHQDKEGQTECKPCPKGVNSDVPCLFSACDSPT